jgi:DNA-binding NarL/FixJ family response regulator
MELAGGGHGDTDGSPDGGFVAAHAGVILGWVLCETGEPARGVDLIVTSGGGEDLPRVTGGWRTGQHEVLTRSWLALGRPDQARLAAARARTVADDVGLPRSEALARSAAAAVALYDGDAGLAVEEARASVTAAASAGALVDAAQSRILLGRALASAGDTASAAAELEQAAAAFDAFGAPRLRDRAEQELRKLGRHISRRSAPPTGPGQGIQSLSGRELEVARLVVDRRTNPEIASALFLSLKTVETHMRNIFRKLEVTSRVEVARLLAG